MTETAAKLVVDRATREAEYLRAEGPWPEERSGCDAAYIYRRSLFQCQDNRLLAVVLEPAARTTSESWPEEWEAIFRRAVEAWCLGYDDRQGIEVTYDPARGEQESWRLAEVRLLKVYYVGEQDRIGYFNGFYPEVPEDWGELLGDESPEICPDIDQGGADEAAVAIVADEQVEEVVADLEAKNLGVTVETPAEDFEIHEVNRTYRFRRVAPGVFTYTREG